MYLVSAVGNSRWQQQLVQGNIVSVATAVALGSPGAIFWCWMTGLFGIATKYGFEALLAIKLQAKLAFL